MGTNQHNAHRNGDVGLGIQGIVRVPTALFTMSAQPLLLKTRIIYCKTCAERVTTKLHPMDSHLRTHGEVGPHPGAAQDLHFKQSYEQTLYSRKMCLHELGLTCGDQKVVGKE